MTLHFKYCKEEYIDSMRKYLFMRGVITKLQLFIISILVVFEVIILVIKGITSLTAILGLLLILIISLVYILYFYQPGEFFKKTTKLHQDYHLDFMEDKIIFKTNGIHSELQWNIYSALWENEKYYYLLQTKSIYSVIPKRVFLYKEQCEHFKELFRKNNPSAQHKFFK